MTLQETKARKLGSIHVEGYQIFENIRVGGNGGGLLTAVDQNLNPVLISTGRDEDTEILTVQAKVGTNDIRIINGYGPQEDDGKQEVYNFWHEVEQEVIAEKDENCFVVIQMDANAKIGIKDDPNNVTANGKLLMDDVERHNLTIVNKLDNKE